MKAFKLMTLLICLALLGAPLPATAFETDQYNLPAAPLADIGDEVSDYAALNIEKAFEKVNAEIAAAEKCLAAAKPRVAGCASAAAETTRLARLKSGENVVREVFKRLGGGIPPFTNAGTYMEKHKFAAQPARYKTSFADSIFLLSPINYLTISDTVKIYEAEFGTDKVAHFFQQGYSYYKIRRRAVAAGVPPAEAVKKAVRFGQKTERTIYGTLISGVYSNGDLCANYVGMLFYENLTAEITIGGVRHPPILILKNGLWTFNDAINLRENLVKPFLTEHLNEALNPSIYTNFFGFRASVRRIVREKACPQWRRNFPNLTAERARARSAELRLWNGEDYGYTASRNFITIAETCFDDRYNSVEKNN